MGEKEILESQKTEQKKLKKHMCKPLAIEGITCGLSTAFYLNAQNIAEYAFAGSNTYAFAGSMKHVAVIVPIAMGTYLLGYYHKEIKQLSYNSSSIPKREYYLENRDIFDAYNKDVANKELKGNPVTFENADQVSMTTLENAKKDTCLYHGEKVLKK